TDRTARGADGEVRLRGRAPLKFLTWNCANFNWGNTKELALINLLAFNNVDVAAITETEFNEEQSASFAIENYTTFLPLADGDGKRRIVML
ncbi:Hypothetical protein FKW44_005488, partial [Caligus rogercresseyi]